MQVKIRPHDKTQNRLISVRLRGMAAAPALVLGLALPSCGSSAPARHPARSAASRTTASAASFEGPVIAQPAPEPPLALRDYLGHEVRISSYLGRAVLLTFIYTHCPDTCPLIVSNLHNALGLLGPNARNVQIVAVSTDPKGDTPRAVADFLARREMTGRMKYLIGSRRQLTPIWRSWGISSTNATAGDVVAHTALVYGISASGKVTTVYPANFAPAEIAHDVPLLAKQ